jgi:hypothetical protein
MIPPAEEKRAVFVFLDIFFILFSYYSLLGISDFDAQLSGIKFWKSDEILGPVYTREILGTSNDTTCRREKCSQIFFCILFSYYSLLGINDF